MKTARLKLVPRPARAGSTGDVASGTAVCPEVNILGVSLHDAQIDCSVDKTALLESLKIMLVILGMCLDVGEHAFVRPLLLVRHFQSSFKLGLI
jgi:hypothetical protein